MDAAGPAGDVGEVAAARGVARRHRHRHRRDLVQRAAVGDAVAEVGEHADEAGGAQRLRPHRRAARGGAELEAGAEEREVAGCGSVVIGAVSEAVEHGVSIRWPELSIAKV